MVYVEDIYRQINYIKIKIIKTQLGLEEEDVGVLGRNVGKNTVVKKKWKCWKPPFVNFL